MHAYLKRTVALLSLLLLLGAAFASPAMAWGPPGSDGWYLGPDGGWHQGAPWGAPQPPYLSGNPYGWTDGYTRYPYPPGYQYEGYYAPSCPLPAPAPPVYVQPVAPCAYPVPDSYVWNQPIPYSSGTCYSQPPAMPDRYHMSWGTFGTYDNWAYAFSREHGRCPNEQDVRDYWYSQAYAATHCGRSPWW